MARTSDTHERLDGEEGDIRISTDALGVTIDSEVHGRTSLSWADFDKVAAAVEAARTSRAQFCGPDPQVAAAP